MTLLRFPAALASALLAATFGLAARAQTSLTLEFVDAAGNAVTLSKAEILLVAWGTADRIDLPGASGQSSLTLPLDAEWLRSRWPDRFADMEKAYLRFEADGFAAIRSEPFVWIGAHGPPYGPRVADTEIALPSGSSVRIGEGRSAALRVEFRRPEPRRLRILDASGAPVAGVGVRSGMFWSDSNHCGSLTTDWLGQAVSDDAGLVPIPDGDFEYAFELEKPHYVLASADGFRFSPPRLITRLDSAETIVEMRALERKPLVLSATEDGAPAAGRLLEGRLASCGCGACSGPLGTTDADGRLGIPDFYPEEIGEIYFQDRDGRRLWSADPGSLDLGGTVRAELGP